MIALLIGLVFLAFAVYAVLPFPWALNWGTQVLEFLKGAAPVVAALVGLMALFVGIADLKDRASVKKESSKQG